MRSTRKEIFIPETIRNIFSFDTEKSTRKKDWIPWRDNFQLPSNSPFFPETKPLQSQYLYYTHFLTSFSKFPVKRVKKPHLANR